MCELKCFGQSIVFSGFLVLLWFLVGLFFQSNLGRQPSSYRNTFHSFFALLQNFYDFHPLSTTEYKSWKLEPKNVKPKHQYYYDPSNMIYHIWFSWTRHEHGKYEMTRRMDGNGIWNDHELI
jgi:hypothetical protein